MSSFRLSASSRGRGWDEDLRLYLTHLQMAEFLYETNLFPELEYSFKHAITSEVAYGELLRARKVALHSQILKAIEERRQ